MPPREGSGGRGGTNLNTSWPPESAKEDGPGLTGVGQKRKKSEPGWWIVFGKWGLANG